MTQNLWGDVLAWWDGHGSVLLVKAITVVAIVLAAFLIRWILAVVIDRVVRRIVTGVKRRDHAGRTFSPLTDARVIQRTKTLGTVLSNGLNVALFIVATLLVVNVIDPGILGSFAIISAAIGAGIGFGAQNLVKDAFNGLFMVVEDQVGVGDIVDLGFATGMVEEVRIRITKVRDVNGTLWYVRNGEVLRVGNQSQGWSRAIVDVSVPYETDVAVAEAELLKAAAHLASLPEWAPVIIDQPEAWGLQSVAADGLVIRVVTKLAPGSVDGFTRALRAALKSALDVAGIHPPSQGEVVLRGFDTDITARRIDPGADDDADDVG
ncbi:MAG TPA: mechanosensitive ion channel domain-containing protein [Candidatus Lumbricidophila sp.]|nr:mechanosensitive ion channel domain-containing protein [Candidatus Lumbricidophila sp.]